MVSLKEMLASYPEFPKFIEMLDSRQATIIKERMKGKTRREIGVQLPRHKLGGGGVGVTRERVRQLELRAYRVLEIMCIKRRDIACTMFSMPEKLGQALARAVYKT